MPGHESVGLTAVFVTLDGPNGVGKTTVSGELAARLRGTGKSVRLLRQPSDSDAGRVARQHDPHLAGMPLATLVVADRYMQIENEIKPALSAGAAVVCDRYVASTLVLQRIDGLDLNVLWQMNSNALVPDLSVFLSASAATIHSRLNERGRTSRFDRMADIAEIELGYYDEATLVLGKHGYRVLTVGTEHLSVAEVADGIVGELERFA